MGKGLLSFLGIQLSAGALAAVHQQEANAGGSAARGISRTTGVTNACGVPDVRVFLGMGVVVGMGEVPRTV